MKNGAAGKKNSKNSHFTKALPWFNHGSTRRGKNAGKKIESALIWGRHLQKGLVKSVGFFFPSRFLCFFFFFENQFLEKPVFKTSFFNHPNTLIEPGRAFSKSMGPWHPSENTLFFCTNATRKKNIFSVQMPQAKYFSGLLPHGRCTTD